MKMYQLFVFSEPEVREGLDPEGCYANAGVFAVDLERYKQLNVSGRIADLVRVHAGGRRLWTQGVQQPSFVLAFLPHARILPHSWNVDALGYSPDKPRVPRCALESGHVLHWNGAHKPWRCGKGGRGEGEGAARGGAPQHDCYASYWRPFEVEAPTEPPPEP
ncbi:hypothetical protein H632_c3168p0 [Helicosporidium sp. ATCC 50920]|nr:hypothetical protein H632_c3168p0 [Helicosporidium sp. ATCC 50920]|eukprot:KDD72580.1 hypothetical protein H632_c3168p0 [Helicosporidium sp. ATCC 50920]